MLSCLCSCTIGTLKEKSDNPLDLGAVNNRTEAGPGELPPPVATDIAPGVVGNVGTATLSGRALPSGLLRIFASATCDSPPLAEVVVDVQGSFSAMLALAANQKTDLFGQIFFGATGSSACVSLASYTHDDIAPAAPSASLDPPPPSNAVSPALVVATEAGARAELFVDMSCAGAPHADAVADASGAARVRAVPVTVNATNSYGVRVVDPAGNASPCVAMAYAHDGAAPSIASFASLGPPAVLQAPRVIWTASDAGAGVASFDVCQATSATGCLQSFTANAAVGLAPSASSFAPTFSSESELDKRYYFRVRANDAAGNAGLGALLSVRAPSRYLVNRVRLGMDHACAVFGDGRVGCWGRNTGNQVGVCAGNRCLAFLNDGSELTNVIDLALGNTVSCALTTSGEVHCWGSPPELLGPAPASTPGLAVQVPLPLPTVALVAGFNHVCALSTDHRVLCWGDNSGEQLGNASAPAVSTAPIQVDASGPGVLSDIVELAAGAVHTCAVNSVGNVLCWGTGASDQIGDGAGVANIEAAVVVQKAGGGNLDGITAVAAGGAHTCALDASGNVWCWGMGQAAGGVNGTARVIVATLLPSVAGFDGQVSKIAAGVAHSCAVTLAGRVYCWGQSLAGAFGTGTLALATRTPTLMLDSTGLNALEGIADAALGADTTCVHAADGRVFCTGEAQYRVTDVFSSTDVTLPLLSFAGADPVLFPSSRVATAAIGAANKGTCSLGTDGVVLCLGEGLGGEVPVPLSGIPIGGDGRPIAAISLSVGATHACVLLVDGDVYCWGKNDEAQLGTTVATVFEAAAVKAQGGNYRAVSVGDAHTCVVTSNRHVQCWGRNTTGQLGFGTPGPFQATGSDVLMTSGAALDQVTDLSAGGSHSCAIRLGVPLCWGDNTADRLGRGSSPAGPVDRAGPVRESNADMTKVNRVRAGREFSCAINNDSKVYCWGNNSAGMLGVNTTTATESQAKLVRYLLSAFNMYIDIGRELSVGARHACTVTATGTMFCWGDNAAWQLGNGGLANQKTASVVGNGMGSQDGARGVAAGVSHTCATLASGGNVCFGDDSASESTAGPPTGVVPFAQPIRHLP